MNIPRTPYTNSQQDANCPSLNRWDTPSLENVKGIRRDFLDGQPIKLIISKYDHISRSSIYRIINYKTFPEILKDLRPLIRERVDKLPEPTNDPQTIQLYYHYGLTVTDITDLLDCSTRTVYRHL